MTHDDGIEHIDLVVGELILLQNGDALVVGNDYLATGRFNFTFDDFEKGRLAGSVGANETIAVTRQNAD